MEAEVHERSLPDLVREITNDVQRLVRDEMRLARAELSQNLREAAMGAGLIGIAGALAFIATWFVAFAIFFALFLVIPGWAAGLVTAAFLFIVAGGAALIGRSRLKPSEIVPEQTIRSLEEDREWLERRIR